MRKAVVIITIVALILSLFGSIIFEAFYSTQSTSGDTNTTQTGQ